MPNQIIISEAREAMLQVWRTTAPGTQARFDAVDVVVEKYGLEVMQQAFPVEIVNGQPAAKFDLSHGKVVSRD